MRFPEGNDGHCRVQFSLILVPAWPRLVNKEIIDALLSAMISSSEGISDLLFAVGRPPIIEEHGVLHEFPVETATGVGVLDSAQIGQIAAQLMGDDDRLKNEFATYGSCDCSYFLPKLARFRVNIFKQNGEQAIV